MENEEKPKPYSVSGTRAEGARTSSKKALSSIIISARRLALAVVIKCVFKYVTPLEFPNGGSISIVMAPLVLNALYCGPVYGFSIAFAYGVIDRLIDGAVAYHWLSLILDYFVGFGVLGVAFIFHRQFFEKKTWSLVAGRSLAGACRFVSSFFSGLLITWGDDGSSVLDPQRNAGGFIYSLGYNLGYRVPSILICALLLVALSKPLFETLNLPLVRPLTPKGLRDKEETKVSLSLETGFSFIAILSFLLAVFALIPPCGESLKGWNFWSGYFWLAAISGVISLFTLFYALYQLIYSKRLNESYCGYFKVKRSYSSFYLYRILVSLFLLILSLIAIVGRFTFYAPLYSSAD